MKKLVILVLFSLIGLTTMAQSLPINIGIHGGWNDAKIKAKEYKVEINDELKEVYIYKTLT